MLCKLKVEGQTLRWYGEPEVLAADSVDFVGFEFILPEDWDGYTLHATFQQADKAYTQVLEDRKCTLPPEIVVGNCGIGLFGYQPGKSPRATTNLLNVQVCQSGFVPDGEYPVPPTPDLYSQLLSQLDSKVDEAEQFAVSAVQAAQQAQSHANQVKSEADLVVKLSDDVAKKATQASDDSTAAAQAKEAAETAKRLAETARDAAETAQKAAETAQSAAAQSATNADAAKQAAEAALKSAQNAAGEAANALSDLRELYQQMQTWAAGVVQDINAEGSNAIQSVQAAATAGVASVNAAGDAQVQRVEYEATHAGDIQVERVKSEGSKYAQMAVDAAKVAQDKAAEVAGKSDQIEANTVGLNELKQDVAAITPDDTAVNGKPWTSKKIVDTICQPFEESGNPVQVYPVENYPLGVKASWEPAQEGEGDPSPDNIRPITGRDSVQVTRCGKNLLDFSSFANYTNWRLDIATEGNSPTSYGNKGYILPVKPSKTYTISFESLGDTFPEYLYLVKSINGVSKRYAYITTDKIEKKVVSFTPEDNEIWYLRMGNTFDEKLFNAQIEKITYIQLELGTIATPYEHYTGNTYDIALPETVYGGTLDVETGVVTVDRGITIADGTTNKFSSGGTWGLPLRSSPGIVETYWNALIISSHFKGSLFASNKTYEFIFTSPEKMTGLFDTVDELNVYLVEQNATGTPVKFVYKLAKPYTIQLTPQQIAALSGVNTLYTDADGVVVTGAEDPKHTITELKNAIISLGGNV